MLGVLSILFLFGEAGPCESVIIRLKFAKFLPLPEGFGDLDPDEFPPLPLVGDLEA